jgi:hypothetical protein
VVNNWNSNETKDNKQQKHMLQNKHKRRQTQNKHRVAATQKNKRRSCSKLKTNGGKPEKQTTKLLQNTKTNGDHTQPPTTTTREAVVAEIKADPL